MKKPITRSPKLMRITALAFICFITLISTIEKAHSQAWTGASLFGTTGTPEWGKAVCLDASGNYYVTGVFQGTTTFNNGQSVTSAGVGDVFVAKFNSAGTCQWAVRGGGTGADGHNLSAGGICTDGSSVYFGSQFSVSGGTFGATTLTSAGSTDAFVAKLNASTGAYIWAVGWGGTSFNDNCQSLILDPSGNLYACGNFTGATGSNTNCTILGISAFASGISEACVIKINPATGAAVWVAAGGSTASADNNNGSAICYISGLNEIVFTGSATGISGQNAVYGSTTIPLSGSAASTDVVLAEISASTGAWVTAKGLITGSNVNDDGLGIVALSSGSCILTGFFQNTIQFPGNAALNSLGADDMFLASYNPATDVFNWSVNGGGATGQERGQAISYNNSGSVFISGWYTGTATFGTKSLPDITGGANNNAFLVQYDETNGNCLMALGAGGSTSGGAKGHGIAASTTGNNVVIWTGQGLSNSSGTGGTISYGTFNVSPLAITPNGDIVIAKASAFVPLSATQSQTNASCFGVCNGSATVTASNGTPPYFYSWSPSGGSGPTASSLCAGNYTCTITDNGGGSVVKNFTITQPVAFTVGVSPGSGTITCTTPSILLTASPSASATYQWSTGATTSSITVSSGNTYTVTATNTSTACTATSSSVISQNTTPPSTAISPPTATITCASPTVLLTASGGGTYLWSTGATTTSITVSSANTYTVTATAANGCTASASRIVTGNTTPPSAAVTPPSASITCASPTALLTASGGGTYLWSTGATTTSITVSSANTYTVTVTGANGCTASASSAVTGNTTPPSAAVTPPSATITCASPTALLTASGGGTYLWSTGATTTSITVSSANTYTVTVTGANGCTASASSAVTGNTTPPSAAVTPPSATITCASPTALLTASGGGTYLWSTGATTTSITVSSANTYTVTVTGANGCTASASSAVTGNTTPPSAAVTPPSASITCASPTALLTASGGGTYLWSTGATTTSITVSSANTYTVTVTGANGCTASASSAVTGNTTPPSAAVTPPSATITCASPTALLTASGGGTYLWSTGATTTSITVSSANTYTVTVTGANGCTASASSAVTGNTTPPSAAVTPPSATITCASPTALLTASGGGTYLWSTGATTTSITVSSANTYTVTVTGANGCTASASSAVTGNTTPPTPTITGGTSFCSGGSTTLDAGSGYSLYNWSTGATTQTINVNTATTVTVTVTDGNGCTGSDSKTTTVNANPTPSITGSTSFCTGGSTTLDAGSGYSLYNWSTGATTQTINVNTATTVTVTVTDGNGCTGSDSKTTTINAGLTPTITGSTSFCSGGSTTLDAGSGYSLYNWSTGATTQTINVNTATTVTVTVTDGNGCTGSDNETTTVNTNPAPSITGNTSFCSGGSTTLDAGSGYSLYNWSTGATTQTINVNTATTVTVTVTDGNGCSGSDNETTTIITAPTATISGNSSICLAQSASVNLSFTGTGPWSGTVSDGSNTVPFGPTGSTSISVNVTPSSNGTHNYTVTALSDANCGTGSGSGTAVILVSGSAPTGTAGTVTAPVSACSGSVSQVLVNAIAGQNVQYSWNQGSGSGAVSFSNNIGGPFSAPPFVTSIPSVYAQFGAAGGSGYDICVQGVNGCGSTNNKCDWVRGKVSVPGNISGSQVACPNDVKNYVAAASVGASVYNWTLGGSAVPVTSGQGTTNVSVTFPPAFVSGQLCVTAALACGGSSTSAPRCMLITKNPAVPGNFTAGPSKVCPGSTNVIFTVPVNPSISTYSWTYPAGCTVNGASNTNSLSLNFPANYSGAPPVCVTAISPCGSSTAKCKTVGSFIPLIPSAIQGPSANICNSTVQFEVNTDPNATAGYLWTNPAGTTISSGQGSNTIMLNVSGSFISGTLSVIAKTASCSPGNSPSRTLQIIGKPATPANITPNPLTWCANATVNFSTTPVSPLPIYTWTTNKGVINNGQGTSNVDITWTSGSGFVKVTAGNSCGTSAAKSVTFTSSCREEEEQLAAGSMQLAVYPNPAHDIITVSADVKEESGLTLQLTDITGRIMLSENHSASEGLNTYELGLNQLAKGVYMLEVKSGSESWKTRVIIE